MSLLRRLLSILYAVPAYFTRCWRRDIATFHRDCKCTTMLQCKVFLLLFRAVNNLLLLSALGCGMYVRWTDWYEPVFVYIAFVFMVVSSLVFAYTYYFREKEWIMSLWRLYVGFLIGVMAFTDHSVIHENVVEEAMKYLLIGSVSLGCSYEFVVRLFNLKEQKIVLFSPPDIFETSGMGIASIISGSEVVPILLLLVAIQVTLLTIRLKCVVSVLYLVCIAVFSGIVYFPKLRVLPVSPLALAVFLSRVSLAPILDLYFLNKTRLERWTSIISWRSIFHKLLIIFMFSMELVFIILTGKHIVRHKEWYVVVPMFYGLAIIWSSFHFVFAVQCWILSNKLSQAYQLHSTAAGQTKTFTGILASKGLRHFSLLSRRLVSVTLISTFFMGAIGWHTKTPISFSLLLIIVPFETLVISFLSEMGVALGGTCVGYALVAPANLSSYSDQPVVLVNADVHQTATSQATQALGVVQNFFIYNMIDVFGCDFSSIGISQNFISDKLHLFFKKLTMDGPCYDTYFLYYSGPVLPSGDWALTDGKSLSLETILEWWHSTSASSSARLILVLDTEHSSKWLKRLPQSGKAEHVAIQTFTSREMYDLEGGTHGKTGAFTRMWMDFNSSNVSEVDPSDPTLPVRPQYAVSRRYTDFRFQLPTDEDMGQYWKTNFPAIMYPLVVITNFPNFGLLCSCCSTVSRWFRRKIISCFPPKQWDTGHGFKLVRAK